MKNIGLGAIFKQAQKLQEDISRIKQELATMKVTGSAGGGMVEVTANGRQQILNIKIGSRLDIYLNDFRIIILI